MNSNFKTPEAGKHATLGAIAETPHRRYAGPKQRKGKISIDEILAIADQVSSYIDSPQTDHGDFLYDENGIPN